MIAVLSSPIYYKDILFAVESINNQILFEQAEKNVNTISFFEKINRLPIKILIIDISSVANEGDLIKCLKNYRIIHDENRIIIIAPNKKPGNGIMSLLVEMGIYDIIPINNSNKDFLNEELIQILKKPTKYRKAVKWYIGQSKGKQNNIQQVIRTDINNEKHVLMFFSPCSTGKTEIASNVAELLSNETNKKVALLDLDFDKFGIVYNYPIKDIKDYAKYSLLLKQIMKYLESPDKKSEIITEKQIKRLAIHSRNDLLVYSGHPESNVELDIDVINYLIKKIKSIVDILIIDIGKNIDDDIKEKLIDIYNTKKYLVINENLEMLNIIPYRQQFKYDTSYENWNLVINQRRNNFKIKDKHIVDFFNSDINSYAKYQIKNIYFIPYTSLIWKYKFKRKCIYGHDEQFDKAIRMIVNDVNIKNNKRNILNFLKNF